MICKYAFQMLLGPVDDYVAHRHNRFVLGLVTDAEKALGLFSTDRKAFSQKGFLDRIMSINPKGTVAGVCRH